MSSQSRNDIDETLGWATPLNLLLPAAKFHFIVCSRCFLKFTWGRVEGDERTTERAGDAKSLSSKGSALGRVALQNGLFQSLAACLALTTV